MTNHPARGTLFVVSTPIGNLEDVTARALRTLREADLIAAEDTRHTGRLLGHFGIAQRVESYHDHNKEKKTPGLIGRLISGKNVVLVSDAGTPGISDPAFYLVRAAVREEIPVVPIPGPSAAIAALVISGLPTDRFVFEGFLPAKKGRKTRIRELSEERRTLILFEAPHRIIRTLGELLAEFGDRPAAVCRELTKKFEEVRRGTLSSLLEGYQTLKPKGEYVLIVHGKEKESHAERHT